MTNFTELVLVRFPSTSHILCHGAAAVAIEMSGSNGANLDRMELIAIDRESL